MYWYMSVFQEIKQDKMDKQRRQLLSEVGSLIN